MAITDLKPEEKLPTGKPEKPPRKPVNKVVIIVLVVLVAGIGYGAWWFLTKTESEEGQVVTQNSNLNQNTNSATDQEALGDLGSDQYNVPGYSFFKSEEYNFSTIYKTKWIVKEYSEQDLGNGDISKLFAFYSFDDYQSISSGKAPNYQGSVFIEIHKPVWDLYQDAKTSGTSYILSNNPSYHDTTDNIIYAEVDDYVYSIGLRGSQNTDVFENMLKYFHFTSQTGTE
ncbi:MAG: hypothetical protein ABIB97_05205 [Patescibacteria group bacterium]